MCEETNDIFISYRRKGGEWFANYLYLRLSMNGYSVFLDIHSLRGGKYGDDIKEKIKKCKDVILVLPSDALVPREGEDLYLEEIITARKNNKNIIPIMMAGFKMPEEGVYEQVGKNDVYNKYIKDLGGYNGCEIQSSMEFEGAFTRLADQLLDSKPKIVKKEFREITKQNCDHYIVSDFSTSETYIEGSRDAELDWLEYAIECSQPTFLWGFGGVGKTELALRFAQRQREKRNVFMIKFDKTLRNTIININFTGYRKNDLEGMSYEERQKVEEIIYQDKLKLLYEYSDMDILIIDDFQSDEKTIEQMKMESSYKDLMGVRMHIIFTTRSKPDDITPEVLSIEKKDCLKMMELYLDKIESYELMNELIDSVGGHTYTVELIAKMLADPFNTYSEYDILDKIREHRVYDLDETYITTDKDRLYEEKTIYGHIKLLLDISNLTESDKFVLLHTLLIPETGLSLNIFLKGQEEYSLVSDNGISEMEYKNSLKRLIRLSYIKLDKRKKIYLHPIMRQVIIKEIALDVKDLFNYISGYLNVAYTLRDEWFSKQMTTYVLEDSLNVYDSKHVTDKYTLMYRNALLEIAEMFENSYEFFNHKIAQFGSMAVELYKDINEERSIILTNELLDELLERAMINEHLSMVEDVLEIFDVFSPQRDIFVFWDLHRVWCPKAEATLWEMGSDTPIDYGNELEEEHKDKEEKVRNIYVKLQEYKRLYFQ